MKRNWWKIAIAIMVIVAVALVICFVQIFETTLYVGKGKLFMYYHLIVDLCIK